MVAPSTGSHRPIAFGFVLLWLVLIGSLTLVPERSPIPLPATCLICGPLGGVDFILNIGLFLPLGCGVYVLVRRAGAAVAVGLAVTLVVEALQWRIIPGRDASLGDLVANTLGAALGAGTAVLLPGWVRATGRTARRLAVISGLVAAGVLLFGAWLVLPSEPFGRVATQVTAPRPQYDTFSGSVGTVYLNGYRIHATERIHPDSVFDAEAASIAIQATIEGMVRPTRRQSMIVTLANPVAEGLFLGQLGTSAIYRAHTHGARLRLRAPLVRLEGAFVDVASRDRTMTLTAVAAPRVVTILRTSDSGEAAVNLRRTSALAWTALLPWDVAISPAWWPANAAFLAALVLPAAFWASASGRQRLGDWWPSVVPIAAVIASPLVTGVAWPGPGEWGGIVAGIMAGIAARRLTSLSTRG